MRYEDWDVLLFPSGPSDEGKPPVPIREFKTQCHVVPDNEITLAQGSLDLPVLTCCIPGLAAATPFHISIHSWSKPSYSQFTRACSGPRDRVKFQVRVFLDGRLTSSVIFGRRGPWPLSISESDCLDASGEQELLFPAFRPDVMQQTAWSPDEDAGRIRILLSEGFAPSDTQPFLRVKNIIAFSFQHAPLDVLEKTGVAWPCPMMWRQPALDFYAPPPPSAIPPPLPPRQPLPGVIDSHTHSPKAFDYCYPIPGPSRGGVPCGLPTGITPTPFSPHQRRLYDHSSSHCEEDGSPYVLRHRKGQSSSDTSMHDCSGSGSGSNEPVSAPPACNAGLGAPWPTVAPGRYSAIYAKSPMDTFGGTPTSSTPRKNAGGSRSGAMAFSTPCPIPNFPPVGAAQQEGTSSSSEEEAIGEQSLDSSPTDTNDGNAKTERYRDCTLTLDKEIRLPEEV